jgi:hypothetical protein
MSSAAGRRGPAVAVQGLPILDGQSAAENVAFLRGFMIPGCCLSLGTHPRGGCFTMVLNEWIKLSRDIQIVQNIPFQIDFPCGFDISNSSSRRFINIKIFHHLRQPKAVHPIPPLQGVFVCRQDGDVLESRVRKLS